MCGGTNPGLVGGVCGRGRSPRVRGILRFCRCPDRSVGSIPACAGEPLPGVRRSRRGRVYPRVCGGTGRTRCTQINQCGLSPRVRGNRWAAALPSPAPRSIPACAGEPVVSPHSVNADGVYPRVCGGTGVERVAALNDEGLSPRVRGNPKQTNRHPHRQWSIPACAGEPSRTGDSGRVRKVYPRVCGGTRR